MEVVHRGAICSVNERLQTSERALVCAPVEVPHRAVEHLERALTTRIAGLIYRHAPSMRDKCCGQTFRILSQDWSRGSPRRRAQVGQADATRCPTARGLPP